MKRSLLLGLVLAGCGGGNETPGDAGQDGTAGSFTLRSPVFSDGAAIPATYTCNGANTSPPLNWSGAPSGTQSVAVVLTDLFLAPPLVHWVIYDIPASATGLPAAVENVYAPANVAGAHQTASVHLPVVGYWGPCPQELHMYQFTVYALDTATLPGASASTTRTEAFATIQTHRLGAGTLNGTFTPP